MPDLINIHGCKHCAWARPANTNEPAYNRDAPFDSFVCRKVPPPFYAVSGSDFCAEYERKADVA